MNVDRQADANRTRHPAAGRGRQPQFAQSPFSVPKSRLSVTIQGAAPASPLLRKPEVDPAFHFQSCTANVGLRLNHFPSTGFSLVLVTFVYRFQREYALGVKRVGSEVKLLRASFQKQLWTQLGPPLHVPKTRQQCLDLALAAKVDTVELPARADTTAQSWTAFGNINLDTDTCRRAREAVCLSAWSSVGNRDVKQMLDVRRVHGLKRLHYLYSPEQYGRTCSDSVCH